MFVTHRPRNVDSLRSAGLLYGDLGTSKAYVIGLAFALAGYASFWLIAAVSLLTILVGINYIIICTYYPNGGGVYASVRHRSALLSMVGAFFLIADYLVTAALSSLSACSYLGAPFPLFMAGGAVFLIGLLNYLGPRHTGSIAFIGGLLTFIILTLLIFFSLPHLGKAWHNLMPLKENTITIWRQFVGVIVALSGIEAIANTTGVMKLDPDSTTANPRVTRTAKKAILIVIIEVALYTAFFAFVVNALDHLTISDGNVYAPGNIHVRDSLLRYMGDRFVGPFFGILVAIGLSFLLFSAVNTAITGLIAIQYLMAHDQELPRSFLILNRYGVPLVPLGIATFIPIFLVLFVKDIASLASLYAIGFVGAIATNLGSTSTDPTLPLQKKERLFMFLSFLIMAAIEVTIFVDKPEARYYALFITFIGLLLRALSKGRRSATERQKIHPSQATALKQEMAEIPLSHSDQLFTLLCVIEQEESAALQFALEQSKKHHSPLHLLFIRQQKVLGEKDLEKKWQEDRTASSLFTYAQKQGPEDLLYYHYCVSDSVSDTIVSHVEQLSVNHLIIDMSKTKMIETLLRKKMVRDMKRLLPKDLLISTM